MKMIKRRKIFQSFFWFHSWPLNFFFFTFPIVRLNFQNSILSIYIWSCFLIISKNTSGKYLVLMALSSREHLHVYKILSYKMSNLLFIMFIVLFCYVVCFFSFIWFKSARILRLNKSIYCTYLWWYFYSKSREIQEKRLMSDYLNLIFEGRVFTILNIYIENQSKIVSLRRKHRMELTYFEQLILS